MPVWPQSIYTFGMSLRTAATEFKLRRRHTARALQQRAFRALMPALARTKVWRDAGITAAFSYPDFRSRVAPRGPEHLAAAVARMQAGEADVLWPGPCALFAETAGTTRGTPARVPVTEEFLGHVRRGLLDVALYNSVRARHAGIFQGRHLWLGGSTALKPLAPGEATSPRWVTGATGMAAAALPKWVERHHFEPAACIAQLDDWDARLERIIPRSADLDVTLVATAPAHALSLARAMRDYVAKSGRAIASLHDLWPNFEVLVHTGAPISPFYDELRELLGPNVRFHELYAATEAFVAAQDGEPAAGLRLMTDLGVFFEFLPLADYDPTRLETVGPKLLPVWEVKTGVEYVVFVTTPAGLVRHPLDDVVRFVSVAPPRLVHAGRTTLRLNAFGENLLEKEATDALVAVCRRSAWTLVNFHVAPLFAVNRTGTSRGRHEWWIELKAGTTATPRGPQLAAELDAELQRLHPDYAARRRTHVLEAPFARLVMPGVFAYWRQHAGLRPGQIGPARCRSDRSVADELAQITQFAED